MKTIAPTQLHQLLTSERDLALLDVRTPVEYAEVRVPQASNVPLDSLAPKELFDSGYLSKGQHVYILCRTGGRAKKAAEKFAKEGFSQAVVVEGGTLNWNDVGLPVERGTAKVISLERQVRIVAGSLCPSSVDCSWLNKGKMPTRRGSPHAGTSIPRKLREKQAHATKVRDPGKDQSGTHKRGEADEPRMREVSEHGCDR
jgi:rhodanese-related sulfurtransferase